MQNFEVLPHIADLRLLVKGDTAEEVFRVSLEGMNSVIRGKKQISKSIKSQQNVSVTSIDISMLLVDFLSEVLTLTHNHKYLYFISEIITLNDKQIVCNLNRYKIDGFDEDIKAVTYTEAELIKTDDHFETIIVFDI